MQSASLELQLSAPSSQLLDEPSAAHLFPADVIARARFFNEVSSAWREAAYRAMFRRDGTGLSRGSRLHSTLVCVSLPGGASAVGKESFGTSFLRFTRAEHPRRHGGIQ